MSSLSLRRKACPSDKGAVKPLCRVFYDLLCFLRFMEGSTSSGRSNWAGRPSLGKPVFESEGMHFGLCVGSSSELCSQQACLVWLVGPLVPLGGDVSRVTERCFSSVWRPYMSPVPSSTERRLGSNCLMYHNLVERTSWSPDKLSWSSRPCSTPWSFSPGDIVSRT